MCITNFNEYMHLFALLVLAYLFTLCFGKRSSKVCACANPFDVLRLRVEDLGPRLYKRATWLDPWMNLVPRNEWPVGAGLVRSSFEVGRSEPTTEEEAWSAVQVYSGSTFIGSCLKNFTDTNVGYEERQYNPEAFWLRGPLVCQSDLTLHWNSVDFWNLYFMRLEQRNTRSIVNRIQNVYCSYGTKVVGSTNGTVTTYAGNTSTQPPGQYIDLTNVPAPQCGLDQSLLDSQVHPLVLAGATAEDSGGWISSLGSGPVFSLLIGIDASNQLALNNPELREDLRYSYEGFGDTAEVIIRLGASRVLKNYRHVITATPPRWSINDGGGTGNTVLSRVSPWVMQAGNVDTGFGKGQVAVPNPNYLNPNIAAVEAAIIMTKWNMEEEVLRPVNAAPGMKWMPQDYYGEWKFVTGNDAFLGMDGCAGVADPFHEYGRHFAQYKHAFKPIFPDFARVFLFLRCPSTTTCLTCS